MNATKPMLSSFAALLLATATGAGAAVGGSPPAAAAVGVSAAAAGASAVTIRVTSTVTGVAATGVPQAASIRLASTIKLKIGNNLRMIFFSFSRIFCLGKTANNTKLTLAPPILYFI